MTVSWSRASSGWSVLVHGGAGQLTSEQWPGHAEGCRAAVAAAGERLAAGQSALAAVEQAVCMLEDDPRFNAGTGASLTSDGRVELDASIMEGQGLRAGAVCVLGPYKNPVAVARAVLSEGRHVLYAGRGADAFADRRGFIQLGQDALITEAARRRLAAARTGRALEGSGATVGAVARDSDGTLAAATSTGGLSGKAPGRVGDSAVIGAGNYADNESAAVSATGLGEGMLRVSLAHRVATLLRMGAAPEAAVRDALETMRQRVDATAGLIGIDAHGRLSWARTASNMSWAAVWDGHDPVSGV